jgi:serine/threonine protein kinase
MHHPLIHINLLCTCYYSGDNDVRDMTQYVGSRWYRAPEQLAASANYSTQVKIAVHLHLNMYKLTQKYAWKGHCCRIPSVYYRSI